MRKPTEQDIKQLFEHLDDVIKEIKESDPEQITVHTEVETEAFDEDGVLVHYATGHKTIKIGWFNPPKQGGAK